MLATYGFRSRGEFETEATQKPVGSSAPASLRRALFSSDLYALYADAVGLSFFLLVPVCLGHHRLGFAGDRLSQVEDLAKLN